MIKQAERIETIAHLIIDKVAEVAASIAKAVVTLICLGASVSYKAGVKVRDIFDNASNDITEPVTEPVTITDEVEENIVVIVTDNTEVTNNPELRTVLDLTDQIINTIQTINLYKPINKTNHTEDFIRKGLKDSLEDNYLTCVSYELPKNKRVKTKTHKRLNSHGILHEHYDFIVGSSLIHKFW